MRANLLHRVAPREDPKRVPPVIADTPIPQCYHALGNSTSDGPLGEPMFEHIRQNRHKHVRQPQVHFVGQTI